MFLFAEGNFLTLTRVPPAHEKWNIPLVGNQGFPYQFLNQIYGLGIFVETVRELLVLFLCSHRSFSNTEQFFIHIIWTFQQNFGF